MQAPRMQSTPPTERNPKRLLLRPAQEPAEPLLADHESLCDSRLLEGGIGGPDSLRHFFQHHVHPGDARHHSLPLTVVGAL